MKNKIRTIWKTIGILLGGTIAGAALCVVSFLLPVNEVTKEASYEILEKEGWYPAIPIVSASLDTYFHSYLPGVLDGSTDAIMIHTALETREENALRAAMDMRGYDYYWHGYVAVLKPLLCLFDYGEIRTLNGFLQLLLLFCLFARVNKKRGLRYALMVPTTYCLLMSLAMPFSLQYSWVFYIAVTAALILTGENAVHKWKGRSLYWLFMVVGMCTSYFDLLTYPLFTWGFPLIWFLLMQEETKTSLDYVKEVVYTGLWWILGYGGFWVMKWTAGSLILGRNIFESAMYEVGFRLGAEEGGGLGWGKRLEVLYNNWKHYEYKIYVLVLAAWLVYFILATVKRGMRGNVKNKALALTGCSGIVWYMALANHTGGHHFFTYRIYVISILAVLSILAESMGENGKAEKKMAGAVCKRVVLWCLCGVLGCCFALFAREDIKVTNGDRPYRQVTLETGTSCRMRFTPSFPRIQEIGICVQTASREGTCRIRLWEEGVMLYQEEIPLSAYEEQTYASVFVDWKLNKEREYEMEIDFPNAEEECFLLVSENMDMPVSEYGEVTVEGQSCNGQVLSVLSYRYRPLSKFTIAFLAMTWCGIIAAIYGTFGRHKDREWGNCKTILVNSALL